MIGAETADIHGFQSSYPAVIFQLHAGKIPERIGYGMGGEPLQCFSRQDLHGNNLSRRLLPDYHYFTKTVHLVGIQRHLRKQRCVYRKRYYCDA